MASTDTQNEQGKINKHIIADDAQLYRTKICNAFLYTSAVLAIPALTASLLRMNEIGWQPVMLAHIIIAIGLWLTALLQNKVPYPIKAGFIVSIFIIIALGGIYQFGLVAGGIAFLVVTAPIATLLFNGKTGTAILIAGFSGAAVIGYLTVTGSISHAFDVSAYNIARSSWINSIIGWALASAAMTASLHAFNQGLIQALRKSHRQQKELSVGEKRLQMVLEGSEQGFWDWNIETGEVQRNDRWAQMLGYDSIAEFEDNTDTWTNAIHPEDRDIAWNSINDHLKGKTDAHNLEYRMLMKDGGFKWILDHAKIVERDTDGKPMRMSGTHTDISDLKKLQEEREQSIRSLQEALDEVKVLKGIIPICSYCHSIRNDEGAWNELEAYMTTHSDAEFSHGICPKCLEKVRTDAGLDNDDKQNT